MSANAHTHNQDKRKGAAKKMRLLVFFVVRFLRVDCVVGNKTRNSVGLNVKERKKTEPCYNSNKQLMHLNGKRARSE